MKYRFVIDTPRGRQVMVVNYSPAMNKTEQRRIYQEYLWPLPKIEGVVWYYPNVPIEQLEIKAFEEVPTFVIDEVHYMKAPPSVTRLEAIPTRSGKLHPRQPKPSHRDLYRNRKNGRRS